MEVGREIGEGIIQSYGSTEADNSPFTEINTSLEVSEMTTVPDYRQTWDEELDIQFADQSPNSFTRVETPLIGNDTFGDDTTAAALESCKTTVLRPYHIFLKCIGWRKFTAAVYDMNQPLHYRICNVIWPILLTVLLLMSFLTQILVCFSRDLIKSNPPIYVNGTPHYQISCSNHIMSNLIILDVLLAGAYLYGLYTFRFKLPEFLSTFTETVFLGIISRRGNYSPKYLVRSLQFFLVLGVLWILYSFIVSILRIFAQHLNDVDSTAVDFQFIGNYSNVPIEARIVLLGVSLGGFIVFDMAYSSIVINYAMQCQLMVYYLQSISTRILAREWDIDEAIKQVHMAKQFLSRINSHLSRAVGTVMFIFLYGAVLSMYGLQLLKSRDPDVTIIAITGFLSIIQWSLWLLVPLIQAGRVTRSAYSLKKTALEIRSRPYSYKDMPQLDLDSFVTYCSNIDLQAKLISIPISPMVVVGGAFILAFILFLVFELDNYSWAKWL